MIEIAVCDEESNVLEQVSQIAKQSPQVSRCDVYEGLDGLMEAIAGGKRYQAVLVGTKSTEQVKRFQEKVPDAQIIYMSELSCQIQTLFLELPRVFGIVIKPVEADVLNGYLCKLASQRGEGPDGFVIKIRSCMHMLRFDQVMYMESTGHMVEIQTKEAHYAVYDRLQRLIDLFPDYFIQCHKSYFVNLREVKRIESRKLVMANGEEIPISKSRYRDTKKLYCEYADTFGQSKTASDGKKEESERDAQSGA